jgi:hypothetical protein
VGRFVVPETPTRGGRSLVGGGGGGRSFFFAFAFADGFVPGGANEILAAKIRHL